MLDERRIRQLVASIGIGSKFISKDEKITILLKYISRSDDLIFKGGTAINRIHLKDRARFSEDIDVEFPGALSYDEKVSRVDDILKDVEGFEIKGPRQMYITFRYDAYYINEFGEKDRVMLDVLMSDHDLRCARPVERTIVDTVLVEGGSALVRTYSLEDLIAQKMMALWGRYEGKDVYDLFFALDLDFDPNILNEAIRIRLELDGDDRTVPEFIGDLVQRRERFLQKWVSLMNRTNHYIPRRLRPEWRGMIRGSFDKIEALLPLHLNMP